MRDSLWSRPHYAFVLDFHRTCVEQPRQQHGQQRLQFSCSAQNCGRCAAVDAERGQALRQLGQAAHHAQRFLVCIAHSNSWDQSAQHTYTPDIVEADFELQVLANSLKRWTCRYRLTHSWFMKLPSRPAAVPDRHVGGQWKHRQGRLFQGLKPGIVQGQDCAGSPDTTTISTQVHRPKMSRTWRAIPVG